VKEGENMLSSPTSPKAPNHYGDMDFKVAGTRRHHRAAMDIKVAGITSQIMREALAKAHVELVILEDGRDHHRSR